MSRRTTLRDKRKGNIVVLTMLLLVGLMAMIAFAVDVGYLCVTRQQLQRTADAAAMAGCWELVDVDAPLGMTNPEQLKENACAKANDFAQLNPVLRKNPTLDPQDIQVGYLADPSNPASPFVTNSPELPNAVRVRVRRSHDINGAVPLFFARVLGINDAELEAEATAALLTNITGFRTPPRGKPIGILPFALDEDTYDQMISGVGTDDWCFDPLNHAVVPGSDGIIEANLYPQGTGSPGNRGTVDIGSNNNSTADISRQITGGVTAADLAHHGGKIELDENGVLYLNGDTGISAGIKDELASVVGEPKMIPVFRSVVGNGNNATYTIVKFVGVRVLDVKLTGAMNKKRVMIQPATICTSGAEFAVGNSSASSYIYSPVWLVR